MKFGTTALTNKPAEAGAPVTPGGDDWLSRVTGAIKAFKEVLSIAAELRGQKGEANDQVADQGSGAPPPAAPKGAPKGAPMVALMLQHYGDKTVSEILKQLGPLTLNQIAEEVKRAGFGK
ncbi:hypothetical protein ES708_06787 [subsurface metagenome]